MRELSLPDFAFADSMKASDVPGWDSLNHVTILAAVEKEFAVRFRTLEALRLKTLGDLQRLLDEKLSS